MELNYQSMTLQTISDMNSLKLSEKDLMKLIVFLQGLKVMGQDFIGLIILELLLSWQKLPMDMLNF